LWRIYGPIKDNLMWEWRLRMNVELERLYSNSDMFKTIRRGRYCTKKLKRVAIHALISEPYRERAFGNTKNALG